MRFLTVELWKSNERSAGLACRRKYCGSHEQASRLLRYPVLHSRSHQAGFAMEENASSPKEVTALLLRWRDGDTGAENRLLEMVYSELHRLAAHYMRQEREEHTIKRPPW